MAITNNLLKSTVMVMAALLLVGCAGLGGGKSDVQVIAEAIRDKPPSECRLPMLVGEETQLIDFKGKVCDEAGAKLVEAQKFASCAPLAEANETLCIFALTNGNGTQRGDQMDEDTQVLLATMNNAAADRRQNKAILANIATLGVAGTFDHLNHKETQQSMRVLYRGATRPSTMNITQSNDGGAGGEGATSRGGDGDLYVTVGDKNQSLVRSPGGVTNMGRNPVIQGNNQPESSFDPSRSTTFAEGDGDQNAQEAPIGGAQNDDDGGQGVIFP